MKCVCYENIEGNEICLIERTFLIIPLNTLNPYLMQKLNSMSKFSRDSSKLGVFADYLRLPFMIEIQKLRARKTGRTKKEKSWIS